HCYLVAVGIQDFVGGPGFEQGVEDLLFDCADAVALRVVDIDLGAPGEDGDRAYGRSCAGVVVVVEGALPGEELLADRAVGDAVCTGVKRITPFEEDALLHVEVIGQAAGGLAVDRVTASVQGQDHYQSDDDYHGR